MMTDLLQFIQWLKTKLETDPSFCVGKEEHVKTSIINPVLMRLGWEVENPSYVFLEYSPRRYSGRVDYGLLIPERDNKLQCVIEAKARGANLNSFEDQLFKYISSEVPWLAILTDGRKWRFYSPRALGKYEQSLVHALDIQKDPLEEVVRRFNRYLSFERVSSAEAMDDLDSDHKEITIKRHISRAWAKICSSDELIDLLTNETRKISGPAPERRYVEEFLRGLQGDEEEGKDDPKPRKGKIRRVVEFLTPLIKEGIYTRKQLQEKAEKQFDDVSPNTIDTQLWGSMKTDPNLNKFPYVVEVDSTTKFMKFTKEVPKTRKEVLIARNENDKKIRFFLWGEEYTEATAISAYIKIFTILSREDEKFLEELAPKTKGPKNQWLSKNRDDMSNYEETEPLLGGWWLDKNISNEYKNRRLRKACEVAGIPFGKREGLKVPF